MANQLHESNRITVTLSRDTYDKLRALGKYGDAMDDIVQRLLKGDRQ